MADAGHETLAGNDGAEGLWKRRCQLYSLKYKTEMLDHA
jgi:hypothetical protein